MRYRNNQIPRMNLLGKGTQESRNKTVAKHHDEKLVGQPQSDNTVKIEEDSQLSVSYTPTYDSYYDSDYGSQRPSKVPKINKDGVPRKPRQPRPKLLKWSDNDWKNVVLGIIWACGETGVQIPFDQAAQVVGESCTAGALQQAILKLRGKQIAEGNQIPALKMAWTRKNRNSSSSPISANVKNGQMELKMSANKQQTLVRGNQSLIVTLKRAYRETDRRYLPDPKNSATEDETSSQASEVAFTPESSVQGDTEEAEEEFAGYNSNAWQAYNPQEPLSPNTCRLYGLDRPLAQIHRSMNIYGNRMFGNGYNYLLEQEQLPVPDVVSASEIQQGQASEASDLPSYAVNGDDDSCLMVSQYPPFYTYDEFAPSNFDHGMFAYPFQAAGPFDVDDPDFKPQTQ